MKNYVLIFLILLMVSCGNKNKANETEIKPEGLTEIVFTEEILDFGLLTSGEILVNIFEFTNTGEHSFFIEKVNSDCGCVKVRYLKKLINPGEKGQIEVEFDSSGLFGKQFKSIEILANCKEPKHLAIFAEVKNENLEVKY